MRSISRAVDVSINTMTKLLVDAGTACALFQDAAVRHVKGSRIQCYEIWSLCYAKQGNEEMAKNPLRARGMCGRGRPWTLTASSSCHG
jgi:hypothetical protein